MASFFPQSDFISSQWRALTPFSRTCGNEYVIASNLHSENNPQIIRSFRRISRRDNVSVIPQAFNEGVHKGLTIHWILIGNKVGTETESWWCLQSLWSARRRFLLKLRTGYVNRPETWRIVASVRGVPNDVRFAVVWSDSDMWRVDHDVCMGKPFFPIVSSSLESFWISFPTCASKAYPYRVEWVCVSSLFALNCWKWILRAKLTCSVGTPCTALSFITTQSSVRLSTLSLQRSPCYSIWVLFLSCVRITVRTWCRQFRIFLKALSTTSCPSRLLRRVQE